MLVSQKLGVKDLSGPVGIVKTVGDQYTQAAAYGFKTVFFDNGKLDHFDQRKPWCDESIAITSIGWWPFIVF